MMHGGSCDVNASTAPLHPPPYHNVQTMKGNQRCEQTSQCTIFGPDATCQAASMAEESGLYPCGDKTQPQPLLISSCAPLCNQGSTDTELLAVLHPFWAGSIQSSPTQESRAGRGQQPTRQGWGITAKPILMPPVACCCHETPWWALIDDRTLTQPLCHEMQRAGKAGLCLPGICTGDRAV